MWLALAVTGLMATGLTAGIVAGAVDVRAAADAIADAADAVDGPVAAGAIADAVGLVGDDTNFFATDFARI